MIRILFSLLLCIFPLLGSASDTIAGIRVFHFSIYDEIAPPAVRITTRALAQAQEVGADLVILRLNTYGGLVDAADSIRTRLLNATIPVYVLVDNNAASAGALIAIACDSIFMMPGSTIGAATVVDQTGQQVPDKYQSYMRKKMRATAEINGRDPLIAEAMVDPDVVIPGIIDSGKVLTFTVAEAISHGYCEGQVTGFEDLIKRLELDQATLIHYEPTWIDSVIGFLINPFVSSLLIMLMIGGLYFELQSPGIGFPFIAAVTAATLYFAPLYLEGLAQHWEILVFLAGLILIIVELFVIPGFGVAGISGIALVLAGLTLSLVGNIGFDFPLDASASLLESLLIVIVSSITAVAVSIYFGGKFIKSEVFSRVVLATELGGRAGGGESSAAFSMAGEKGLAATDLRPSGKILLQRRYLDATAEAGYIAKGEEVEVVRKELGSIYVKRVRSNQG